MLDLRFLIMCCTDPSVLILTTLSLSVNSFKGTEAVGQLQHVEMLLHQKGKVNSCWMKVHFSFIFAIVLLAVAALR